MVLKSDIQKNSVMIIGGGMAGMTAAQTLSDQGINVHLIEKSDHLGGHASSWACMATDTCQHCSSCLSPEAAHNITPNENLITYLNTQVIKIDKTSGTFLARLQGDTEHTIEVSKVIVATGFTPTQPEELLRQAYNASEQIITTAELNSCLKNNTYEQYFSDTDSPKIGFIQCVGSRNREKGRDYCSQVCCKISLRHIQKLTHLYPNAKISLFYIDLQIIGKETRAKFESLSDHIDLIQGVPFEIFTHEDKKLSVIKEDNKSGNRLAEYFDMMVLSVGIQASENTFDLANMLDIPLNQWGFIEAPDSLAKNDIYIAGCAAGPVDILTAKQQGIHCAEQIIQSFNSKQKRLKQNTIPVAIIGDETEACNTASALLAKGYDAWMFGLNDKKTDKKNGKKEIKIRDIHYIPDADIFSINGTAGDFKILYHDFEKIKQETFAAIIVAEAAKTIQTTAINLPPKMLYSLNPFLKGIQNSPEDVPQTLVFWLDYSHPEYKTFSRTALVTAIALAKKGKQITFIMNNMLVYNSEGQQVYDTARKLGIRFLRIDSPDDVSIKQEYKKISFYLKEKTLKNAMISFESDWLIIPETVQPSKKNPMIASLLKDYLDRDGYLQSPNVRHRLTNSPRNGIFYTGSCHDETDDQDQALELDLILASIHKITERKDFVSYADIQINTKKCKKCLTCLRTCPHSAIILDDNSSPSIIPTACFSCGLCLSSCPALAIESTTFCDASYTDQISKGDIMVFACERSGALVVTDEEFKPHVKIKEVPCVCRISQNILLKALEKGAKKIVLAGCHHDNCRSIKGTQTALLSEKQIAQLPGIANSCITSFPVAANESVKFNIFLAKEFLAN